MNIINKVLEKYDENMEKYDKFLKKIKYYKFKTNKIIFYDEKKNLVNSSRIEMLSIYFNNNNIWSWIWAIPYIKNDQTKLSRNLLNYGLNINIDNFDNIFLKNFLITSRINLNNPLQLDIYIALSSYLLKYPLIIPIEYNFNDKKEEYYIYKKKNYDIFINKKPINTYYIVLLDYEKFL